MVVAVIVVISTYFPGRSGGRHLLKEGLLIKDANGLLSMPSESIMKNT
jgi:hypothetical protein